MPTPYLISYAYLNPLYAIFEELRKLYIDMTVSQALVFLCIATNEGLNMADVERITGLSDSSTSRICSILSHRGNRNTAPLHLIEIRPSKTDGRATELYLTNRGKMVANTLAYHLRGAKAHDRPS